MLCIFPALALLSGCDKFAELDDFQESDPETITSSNLYGTKVLYRPDDYNYDEGSGATDGGTNDYYGKYAWYIINYLYNVYEVANTIDEKAGVIANNPNFPEENIPYLFDSMRYQVNTEGLVTARKTVTADDPNPTAVPLPSSEQYYVVGADTSVAWNWGAPYDMRLNDTNTNAYLTDSEQTIAYYISSAKDEYYDYISGENNVIYNGYHGSEENIFKDNGYSQAWYSSQYFTTTLMNYYLGTENAYETEEQEYSDFVKALEYAIYCYAVDLEPAQVTVTFADDGTPNVQVTGYNATSEQSSVDLALEKAEKNFQILGSFVGLADRQIEKIEAWVLDNIIGEDVVNNADHFYEYPKVTEVVTVDENGEYSYSYEPGAWLRSVELGRDYEGTVANIIQNVCSEVSIGNDDGSDVTIDQRFPASEVMEYAGTANNVFSDSNFAVPGQENSADKIRPYEYQSIVFMVKKEMRVNGVGIALKYDFGLDRTEKGVYDEEEYLEIIVDVNYYNKQEDELLVLASKKVKVYAGPWDEENVYNVWPNEEDNGKGENWEETRAPAEHCSGIQFHNIEISTLGKFTTDIGDGALMTDVGKNGYSASLLISEKPLVLVGTTDARKYYEIVEPGSSELDNEQIPKGYTYLSGRFNSDMFSGVCDYLEVTFKVLKPIPKPDQIPNPNRYKFYAGAYLGGLIDTGPDYD